MTRVAELIKLGLFVTQSTLIINVGRSAWAQVLYDNFQCDKLTGLANTRTGSDWRKMWSKIAIASILLVMANG
ncbi:MAG: hypothetical protein ACJA1I_001141 [Zhongshania marina]|jgi:hypothetical protein